MKERYTAMPDILEGCEGQIEETAIEKEPTLLVDQAEDSHYIHSVSVATEFKGLLEGPTVPDHLSVGDSESHVAEDE